MSTQSGERFMRQSSLVNMEELEKKVIHIVGVGGIGSWTAIALAKMGCKNITIFDADFVEDHNLAYQFYREIDKGVKKVVALQRAIMDYSGTGVRAESSIYQEVMADGKSDVPNPDIVVLGVDSIEARYSIADTLARLPLNTMVIDGRMGGNQIEIYTTTVGGYKDTLVPPEHVTPMRCSAKSVAYNTSIIGGLICDIVKHIVGNEAVPKKILFDLFNFMIINEW